MQVLIRSRAKRSVDSKVIEREVDRHTRTRAASDTL